jgi:hypothetical protein
MIHENSKWLTKRVDSVLTQPMYNYFRFCGHCLAFPYLVIEGDDPVESGDPENLGLSFETACLSVAEREIIPLPVRRSPSCISRFQYQSTVADVTDESIESGDHENLGIAVGTRRLFVEEREF